MRKIVSRLSARLQYFLLGKPACIIFFGHGIGDDLLCSTVARELKRRGQQKIVMLSRHPDLFENNPDITRVLNWQYPSVGRLRRWGFTCHVPQFSDYDPVADRDIFRREHLLVTMCRIAGISGAVELRPYLTLKDEEKAKGHLFDKQVAIQSGGLPAMPNKSWFAERYQKVSDILGEQVQMIHLGQVSDPPIAGALDLRGKTTLRQSAAILANSQVFVGQVGFLMHLARSVDCRSVIIFGGREEPAIVGYSANENIVGHTPCSPCWQRVKCDFNRECMREIEVETVVTSALHQMKQYGVPLLVETAEIRPPDCL